MKYDRRPDAPVEQAVAAALAAAQLRELEELGLGPQRERGVKPPKAMRPMVSDPPAGKNG